MVDKKCLDCKHHDEIEDDFKMTLGIEDEPEKRTVCRHDGEQCYKEETFTLNVHYDDFKKIIETVRELDDQNKAKGDCLEILEAIQEILIYGDNKKHRKSVIAELRLLLQKKLQIHYDEWN